MNTDDRSWWAGYRGERMVGRTLRLARLFGWRTIHSVPVGTQGSDIDHVLIGPGGVIVLNTKHHRGQRIKAGHTVLFVGKTKTNYLRNSHHEADRAAELLSAAVGHEVDVQPGIVIVGGRKGIGVRTQGIEVTNRIGLLFWLITMPRSLDRAEQDELYAAARRVETWQPRTTRRRREPA